MCISGGGEYILAYKHICVYFFFHKQMLSRIYYKVNCEMSRNQAIKELRWVVGKHL